jgi:hypothetical protein
MRDAEVQTAATRIELALRPEEVSDTLPPALQARSGEAGVRHLQAAVET